MKYDPHAPKKPQLWVAKYIVKNYMYRDGFIINKHTKLKIGSNAGSKRGHLRVGIYGKSLYIHHIVWFLNKRYWPKQMLDHVNRDPIDNRIENLREVTAAQNSANTVNLNKTSYRGVYKVSANTFQAQIWFRRKRYCLGSYSDPQKAYEAFKAKYRELHGVENA